MIHANLIVPGPGEGSFRSEFEGRSWAGATSRSAKTKLILGLRGPLRKPLKVQWSLVLPSPVAADVEAYRALLQAASRNRDARRTLARERLVVAHSLLDCRLSVAEAAQALGITPGWLARELATEEVSLRPCTCGAKITSQHV